MIYSGTEFSQHGGCAGHNLSIRAFRGELLGCVSGEFQGRETCTVSTPLISKQQAPMIQGNVATHITMGILAIGKFVIMNVWGGKKMLDNVEGFIIISSSL